MPAPIVETILLVAGYLFFLLVLTIAAILLRNKTIAVLLLTYISVPLFFAGVGWLLQKWDDRQMAKLKAQNLESYARYCSERTAKPRKVHAKASIASNAALTVRVASISDESVMRFPGNKIALFMWGHRDLSTRSGVRYIEDVLTNNVQAETNCKPSLCYSVESSREPKAPVVRSPYELILGESGGSVPLPALENVQNLSKRSARIVDKRTGTTVAEDTLYFLSGESGLTVCPYAQEQLATFLVEVFESR